MGVSQKGLGNAHTLAVALGKMADQAVRHGLKAGLGQGLGHLCIDLRLGQALGLGHKAQVFLGRLLGIQRRDLGQIPQQLFGLASLLKDIQPVIMFMVVDLPAPLGPRKP